jgi:hypothetical protein
MLPLSSAAAPRDHITSVALEHLGVADVTSMNDQLRIPQRFDRFGTDEPVRVRDDADG